MQSKQRFAIALVIMLCGLLLVPFVALPQEGFHWQKFAGAYGSDAAMGINYTTGAVGSHFLISGFGFKPGAQVTIKVNGSPFATVNADKQGKFSFLFHTEGVGLGVYVIAAQENGAGTAALAAVNYAATSFKLTANGTLRAPPAGMTGAQSVPMPNVAAQRLWMPVVAQ